MWLLILIVVVLLLRAIATSKTAASVPMTTKTVCSAPTAGDCFKRGNTIAPGVPEPPTLHCQHITRGPINVYCGLPVHVTYPIAPPPIKITTPTPVPTPPVYYPKPAPMPVAPITRPILGGGSFPVRGPLMQTSFCCTALGGGGLACGGSSFGTCVYPRESVF